MVPEGVLCRKIFNEDVDINQVDEFLIHKLTYTDDDNDHDPFYFLSNSYSLSNQDHITRNVLKHDLTVIKTSIINHSGLLLLCPALFNTSIDVTHQLWGKFVVSGIEPSYFAQVIGYIDSAESDALPHVLDSTLTQLETALSTRSLADKTPQAVRALNLLCSNQLILPIIVRHKTFMPPTEEWKKPFNSLQGYTLETKSLLGHLLSVTPIDKAAESAAKAQRREYVRMGIETFSSGGLTANQLGAGTTRLRHDVLDSIETSHTVIKKLVKAGGETREETLRWIGIVLQAMEKKATLSHSLDPGRLSATSNAEFMTINLTGEVSFGWALNLAWVLLKLAEPIKAEKIPDLDVFYPLNENARPLLGAFVDGPSLGDADVVKDIRKSYMENAPEPKFISQIFWLAVKSLKVLILPALAELQGLYRRLDATDGNAKAIWSELLCWRVVVMDSNFCACVWNFLRLVMLFILNLVAPGVSLSKAPSRVCAGDGDGNKVAAVPETMVDNVLELIRHMLDVGLLASVLNFKSPGFASPNIGAPWDIVSVFALCVMTASNVFPNVHTRCRGSTTLARIQKSPEISRLLSETPAVNEYVMLGLVKSFIDSQKTSYYDRLSFRLPIIETMADLIQQPDHRDRFGVLVAYNEDDKLFVHFMHLLLTDLSWLMEESTSSLAEVRLRECQPAQQVTGTSTESNNETEASVEPSTTTLEGADESGSGAQALSDERLKEKTRSLSSLTHKSAILFSQLSSNFAQPIIRSRSLLPQAVTCLNCCLNHLVGPRCLSLKVKNYADYAFEPRDLLAKICATYVCLYDADDGESVAREIVGDGRYFKQDIFKKAQRLLSREGILGCEGIKSFGRLRNALSALEDQTELEIDDIPEEYLDPIIQEIMVDPVKLPSSGTVMDRATVERHLMSDEHDPFNRAPLKASELVSLPELKAEIDAFVLSKRKN